MILKGYKEVKFQASQRPIKINSQMTLNVDYQKVLRDHPSSFPNFDSQVLRKGHPSSFPNWDFQGLLQASYQPFNFPKGL